MQIYQDKTDKPKKVLNKYNLNCIIQPTFRQSAITHVIREKEI